MDYRKPDGYWASRETCLAEAKKAMEQEGWETLPCQTILQKHGYSALAHAISRHQNGYRQFRQLLGEESKKRVPDGTWTSIDYTAQQARDVIARHKLRTLPSGDELTALGYRGLREAICAYHGGFPAFRKYLGLPQLIVKKPRKTLLKDPQQILSQLRMLINEHRLTGVPDKDTLVRLGKGGLAHAISEYHGGFLRIRQLMGEDVKLRPSPGTMQNLEHVIQQARKAMEKECWDALPIERDLNDRGYSTLVRAIKTHHGGLSKFRTLLGQHNSRKPNGVWNNQDHIIAETRNVMAEHNFNSCPSSRQLLKLGHGDLVHAIQEHIGFRKLRELLGENQVKVEPGAWRDSDYVQSEAIKFMQQNDLKTLPTQRQFYALGKADLLSGINRYHGGLTAFRAKLNAHLGANPEKKELEDLIDGYDAHQ